MRDRYKKSDFYPEVAESVGRNYHKLRALCFRQSQACFDSRGYDDIFQNTVLYVIQDPESLGCKTDGALIEHFLYRYRMIEFQTVNDAQQLKKVTYADYLQTRKEEDEG